MRLIGLGLKFRMKLHAHEPRMIFDLHDLDQVLFRINSRDEQSGFRELFAIIVVEFIPVTMPFGNFFPSVCLVSQASLG